MAVNDNIDNRSSTNSNNMLRSLTRVANYEFPYKSALHKILPVLSTGIKHFHMSPVANYEQKLPKLPVPELRDSLDKYLRSVMPLLSWEELQKTKGIVEDFGEKGGCGEKLQKFLQEKAACSGNWLEKWWITSAYLGYRLPVVVHSSPGLIFPLQNFCRPDNMIDYTGRLIIAAMNYKHLIDKDKIPVEKMGKDELDMQQYKKFFGTCRNPKPFVDEIEFNPTSRHIVVACNNNYYKVNTVDERGNIISYNQIICQLNQIVERTCEIACPVGILSSDTRDCWANTYKLLTKDCQNKESVREIQTSLFLVCLDKALPANCNVSRLTQAGGQCIHGGGSKYNSGNRWFDKTVQFIVSPDGIVGMTYEHSPSEGQPIAVMTDFVVDNIPKVDPCGADVNVSEIKHLEFNIDKELAKAVTCSSEAIDALIDDLELECTVFKDFGKNFIKKQKLSPDSFIQMAMQLAYYRMYCKPAAHYESAATRKFLGGRTETIRSCSCESVKFAQSMLDECVSDMDKRRYLEAAINAHKKYTMNAVNGLGIDRHFLGLKQIAQENNCELPEFFNDVAFTRSNHFCITSSQVATKCTGLMVYGAVVSDGYAVCYNPRDDDIYFGVSCFKQDCTTSVKNMNESLILSFKDMAGVLARSQKSKL